MTRRNFSLPTNLLMEIQSSFWFRHLVKALLGVGIVVFFCEVVIYYLVLLQCTWPLLDNASKDAGIFSGRVNDYPLKVMMIADTHLLGPFKGHWFDKLRREWQMSRTYATAMTLHQPDVIVFLGDIFDEGQWMDNMQFNKDFQRFQTLFPKPKKSTLIVTAGNHDVGFHYKMTKSLLSRFQRLFSQSESGVEMITIKGTTFLVLNSMALDGDGCSFCASAEKDLSRFEQALNCSLMVHEKRAVDQSCEKALTQLPHYSRPVILQHFPLFRSDDSVCQERDEPLGAAIEKYRERWEVISKSMTKRLLKLNPRAVFNGHIHRSCLNVHTYEDHTTREWTLNSFSWRNTNNPSFILSVFTPDNFAVSRCFMPKESTVLFTYLVSLMGIVLWVLFRRYRWIRYQGFVKLPLQRS
ncbi:metallophosphoesterase 1 [Galendromus occidentalis]|uniref:Metallophosphoesterase 1 n=1 Tax=Galendromus occidentalis TaxID=34638 RepID=A0AAJ6QPH3_9ACAR|nr:metallophosphoesterase 1 [Galendromus occidentalis]